MENLQDVINAISGSSALDREEAKKVLNENFEVEMANFRRAIASSIKTYKSHLKELDSGALPEFVQENLEDLVNLSSNMENLDVDFFIDENDVLLILNFNNVKFRTVREVSLTETSLYDHILKYVARADTEGGFAKIMRGIIQNLTRVDEDTAPIVNGDVRNAYINYAVGADIRYRFGEPSTYEVLTNSIFNKTPVHEVAKNLAEHISGTPASLNFRNMRLMPQEKYLPSKIVMCMSMYTGTMSVVTPFSLFKSNWNVDGAQGKYDHIIKKMLEIAMGEPTEEEVIDRFQKLLYRRTHYGGSASSDFNNLTTTYMNYLDNMWKSTETTEEIESFVNGFWGFREYWKNGVSSDLNLVDLFPATIGSIHPHMGAVGFDSCFGQTSASLSTQFAEFNFIGMASLLYEFLNQVNEGDSAGKKNSLFPSSPYDRNKMLKYYTMNDRALSLPPAYSPKFLEFVTEVYGETEVKLEDGTVSKIKDMLQSADINIENSLIRDGIVSYAEKAGNYIYSGDAMGMPITSPISSISDVMYKKFKLINREIIALAHMMEGDNVKLDKVNITSYATCLIPKPFIDGILTKLGRPLAANELIADGELLYYPLTDEVITSTDNSEYYAVVKIDKSCRKLDFISYLVCTNYTITGANPYDRGLALTDSTKYMCAVYNDTVELILDHGFIRGSEVVLPASAHKAKEKLLFSAMKGIATSNISSYQHYDEDTEVEFTLLVNKVSQIGEIIADVDTMGDLCESISQEILQNSDDEELDFGYKDNSAIYDLINEHFVSGDAIDCSPHVLAIKSYELLPALLSYTVNHLPFSDVITNSELNGGIAIVHSPVKTLMASIKATLNDEYTPIYIAGLQRNLTKIKKLKVVQDGVDYVPRGILESYGDLAKNVNGIIVDRYHAIELYGKLGTLKDGYNVFFDFDMGELAEGQPFNKHFKRYTSTLVLETAMALKYGFFPDYFIISQYGDDRLELMPIFVTYTDLYSKDLLQWGVSTISSAYDSFVANYLGQLLSVSEGEVTVEFIGLRRMRRFFTDIVVSTSLPKLMALEIEGQPLQIMGNEDSYYFANIGVSEFLRNHSRSKEINVGAVQFQRRIQRHMPINSILVSSMPTDAYYSYVCLIGFSKESAKEILDTYLEKFSKVNLPITIIDGYFILSVGMSPSEEMLNNLYCKMNDFGDTHRAKAPVIPLQNFTAELTDAILPHAIALIESRFDFSFNFNFNFNFNVDSDSAATRCLVPEIVKLMLTEFCNDYSFNEYTPMFHGDKSSKTESFYHAIRSSDRNSNVYSVFAVSVGDGNINHRYAENEPYGNLQGCFYDVSENYKLQNEYVSLLATFRDGRPYYVLANDYTITLAKDGYALSVSNIFGGVELSDTGKIVYGSLPYLSYGNNHYAIATNSYTTREVEALTRAVMVNLQAYDKLKDKMPPEAYSYMLSLIKTRFAVSLGTNYSYNRMVMIPVAYPVMHPSLSVPLIAIGENEYFKNIFGYELFDGLCPVDTELSRMKVKPLAQVRTNRHMRRMQQIYNIATQIEIYTPSRVKYGTGITPTQYESLKAFTHFGSYVALSKGLDKSYEEIIASIAVRDLVKYAIRDTDETTMPMSALIDFPHEPNRAHVEAYKYFLDCLEYTESRNSSTDFGDGNVLLNAAYDNDRRIYNLQTSYRNLVGICTRKMHRVNLSLAESRSAIRRRNKELLLIEPSPTETDATVPESADFLDEVTQSDEY